MCLNRLLCDKDRKKYTERIKQMFSLCPQMMKNKFPRANVQQAFIFDYILNNHNKSQEILCVGSYEDTVSESLKKMGYTITNIDPVINYDLHNYVKIISKKFNVVFACSVIEHVKDDTQFITDMCSCVAKGGTGLLTCDFQENYRTGNWLPKTSYRFYTKNNLENFVHQIRNQGFNIDSCNWEDTPHDFNIHNHNYCFATLVFKNTT